MATLWLQSGLNRFRCYEFLEFGFYCIHWRHMNERVPTSSEEALRPNEGAGHRVSDKTKLAVIREMFAIFDSQLLFEVPFLRK